MLSVSEIRSSHSVHWALGVAIGIVGVLAYANTFLNDFVWDDASSVLVNKHVQDPTEFWQLFREDQHPFGRGSGNFYRPLVAASFMADFLTTYSAPPLEAPSRTVPEVSPFLFHLTNLVWHLLAAGFLCAILARIGAPLWVCTVVPLIYVAHPLHTEAIAYISGRADPMSASLGFAGIWLVLRDTSATQRWLGLAGGSVCFALALLCKESATIFPFLLLLLVLLRPAESVAKPRSWKRFAPVGVWFAILGGYAALRMTVLHFASSAPSTSTAEQRLVECCQAFAWYWRLIFLPTGLHMERTLSGTPGYVAPVGALLLLATIGAFILACWKGRRLAAMGIGWFLVAWFPISGLIPLNAPMAEHWMYVPLGGFLWAIADFAWSMAPHRYVRIAICGVAAVAVVGLVTLTALRNRDWRDNETLFQDTLAKNPASSRVHFNLAVTYQDILKDIPGACRHYEAVIALYKEKKGAIAQGKSEPFWDEELESHLSLGRLFAADHAYKQAAQHYETILRITPDEHHKDMVAEAALGMGQIAMATGDAKKAVTFFKQAMALRPELRDAVEGIARTPASSS